MRGAIYLLWIKKKYMSVKDHHTIDNQTNFFLREPLTRGAFIFFEISSTFKRIHSIVMKIALVQSKIPKKVITRDTKNRNVKSMSDIIYANKVIFGFPAVDVVFTSLCYNSTVKIRRNL